jgi:hypothetical protein
MTYANPAWEFQGDSCLSELQRLQNEVLLTTGNLPRSTPTRVLHVAFKIPYVHDYVIKLCKKRAEM